MLLNAGDRTEVTLCGTRIQALFVPRHPVGSVAYRFERNGKRVAFTGGIGFQRGNDIPNSCWGDRDKVKAALEVVRSKLIPWRSDFVFTGHDAFGDGGQFLVNRVASAARSLAKRCPRQPQRQGPSKPLKTGWSTRHATGKTRPGERHIQAGYVARGAAEDSRADEVRASGLGL
jgi:glyoxylase-like metal-dependent hydrolase (beta-lactamase superfamily II)